MERGIFLCDIAAIWKYSWKFISFSYRIDIDAISHTISLVDLRYPGPESGGDEDFEGEAMGMMDDHDGVDDADDLSEWTRMPQQFMHAMQAGNREQLEVLTALDEFEKTCRCDRGCVAYPDPLHKLVSDVRFEGHFMYKFHIERDAAGHRVFRDRDGHTNFNNNNKFNFQRHAEAAERIAWNKNSPPLSSTLLYCTLMARPILRVVPARQTI